MRKKKPIRHTSIFKILPERAVRGAFPLASISLLSVLCIGCGKGTPLTQTNNTWAVVSSVTCAEEWRADDPLRYCSAQADLDGDSIPDEAKLITGHGGRIGVAVWLSSLKGRDPLLVFTPREIPPQLQAGTALGLRKIPSGNYETLCGKGFENCTSADSREIQIKHDALLLFKDDSWGDVVYFGGNGTLELFAHSD